MVSMIEIKLASEIYSESVINEAIVAFDDLAKISYFCQGVSYVLFVSDCNVDETRTAKEFENYLIGLENRRV